MSSGCNKLSIEGLTLICFASFVVEVNPSYFLDFEFNFLFFPSCCCALKLKIKGKVLGLLLFSGHLLFAVIFL